MMGKRQRDPLAHRKGEVDLLLIRGHWYLACLCNIVDADEIKTTKVLGVDLGIVNLATDRDGRHHTVEKVRQRTRFGSRPTPSCQTTRIRDQRWSPSVKRVSKLGTSNVRQKVNKSRSQSSSACCLADPTRTGRFRAAVVDQQLGPNAPPIEKERSPKCKS